MPRRGFFLSSWFGSMLLHAALIIILGLWAMQLGEPTLGPHLLATSNDAALGVDQSFSVLEQQLDVQELTSNATQLVDATQFTSLDVPPPQSAEVDFASTFSTGLDLTGLNVEPPGGGGSRRGDGRSAQFFGSVAYGKNFVFVLDVSGSMGGDHRYTAAAAELRASIDSLTSEQWFCVIVFNHQARAMFDKNLSRAEMLPAFPEHKERLSRWLRSVDPEGGTDPRQALMTALELQPDAIFLLSDGEFRGTLGMRLTARNPAVGQVSNQTIDLVANSNRNRIPIHTISLVDQVGQTTMKQISSESGGTFHFIPDARQFLLTSDKP